MHSKLSTTICRIKDQLIGSTPSDDGIMFAIDANVNYFDYDSDGNDKLGFGEKSVRKTIFVLITAKNNVFIAEMGKKDTKRDIPAHDQWVNTCNHTTEWRISGVDYRLNDIGYGMYREATEHVLEVNRPCYNDTFKTFDLGTMRHKPWVMVDVQTEKDGDNYKRKIKHLVVK
jgi:hypothetical protein